MPAVASQLVIRLFFQELVQANEKENMKAPYQLPYLTRYLDISCSDLTKWLCPHCGPTIGHHAKPCYF